MAKAEPLPFRVELSEGDYLVLLKHATGSSRVSTRLIAAVQHAQKGRVDYYLFTGYQTDGLALRAIALVHAPKVLPAIERALKHAGGR
jgi:hypothetical protein